MAGEDPSVVVNTDVASGDVTIAANSEQHLETSSTGSSASSSSRRASGVPGSCARSRSLVPRTARSYATRASGRGQYTHVKIHLFPGEPGTGYSFQNAIVGNAIPPAFIQSIDDGVQDAVARGILSGRVVEDVRIELYDGSYHDVDSSPERSRLPDRWPSRMPRARPGP